MYEELYAENRGLLRAVARRWAGACARDRAVSVEDLEQAGFFGLVKAAESYTPTDDGKGWATWAAWYISAEIYKALGYRWRAGSDDQPGRCVATNAATWALSLDAPVSADNPEGMTWGDTLADDSMPDVDEGINLTTLQEYVRAAVERLQNRQQRTVIQMCAIEGRPYSEAAAALGVSVERVRQIRQAALRSLRKDKILYRNSRADIELKTPYYARVTVAAFNTTHTSATEKAVLWRLDQEHKRLIELLKPEGSERNEHQPQPDHQGARPCEASRTGYRGGATEGSGAEDSRHAAPDETTGGDQQRSRRDP